MEGFYLMEDHAKPLDESSSNNGDDAAQPEPETREEYDKLLADKKAKRQKERDLLLADDPEPLPVEQREVTAILVKTPPMVAPALENGINEGREAQAVLPIAVIVDLFEFFVDPIRLLLLVLTAMICVVSGISILVSIYNSMSERRQEIAIMRALGAGRGTVMTIILLESTLLALGGGLVGWLAGHALGALASPWIEESTGVRVGFFTFEPAVDIGWVFGLTGGLFVPLELMLIPALVALAIVVGLWPAITAYRTDVAKSLGK
jgi:putative ABC transport system permease protein